MVQIKESYNTERLCLGEKLPLNTPLSVIIDLSERCNFKCNYCFRSGEKNESWGYTVKNELMTMEVFETVVQQISQFPQPIKVVSLSGHGEPLCNPNIAKMINLLRESTTVERIEMHTNASLLTEESIVKIQKAGLSRIVVSLQGLDSSKYEDVCGAKINWEKFYNNLKRLYENKEELEIHIKISEAALDKNYYSREKEKFYKLFGDIADSIFIEKVTPLWKNIKFDMDETKNKFGGDLGQINYCPIVFYKIWVAPDGEIFPCTTLPPPISLGNVRDTSLLNAWNSIERRNFLIEHLHSNRYNYPPCKDCFVPVNTVVSKKDIIDSFKDEILKRLEERNDD